MHLKSTILALFLFTILGGCKEEKVQNDPQPCEPIHSAYIIGKWHGPLYDGGLSNCVDALCIEFELNTYEDSTYSMDYLLFCSRCNPFEIYELADTGTYNFTCESTGSFTTRFHYNYIEGILELNSLTEPARILNIRWDGFWGLEIRTGELGLDFDGRLLVQKEE